MQLCLQCMSVHTVKACRVYVCWVGCMYTCIYRSGCIMEGRHGDRAFDIDYVTGDTCSNAQFLALLRQAVRKQQVTSMRSFLNALHGANLVLQSNTQTYRLITGKGQESVDPEATLRAECLRLAQTEPGWMLKYGPAGDLPIHLTFLLGKRELGREMLESLQKLDTRMQNAYWDHCVRLHARHPDTIEEVPVGNRDTAALIRCVWCVCYGVHRLYPIVRLVSLIWCASSASCVCYRLDTASYPSCLYAPSSTTTHLASSGPFVSWVLKSQQERRSTPSQPSQPSQGS